MASLIVNLVALALMGFIVWWFWWSRPAVKQVDNSGGAIEVIVENGVYTPAHIEVPAGQRVTLEFIRRDPGPCAEKVLFDALDIALDLPLNEKQAIMIEPLAPGEYGFSCQMQMYRGSLIVK